MNEILFMILTLMAGLGLGLVFFGGLWVTVKKAVASKIPAIWFFFSLLVRVSITLIGFYYLSLGSWQRLLVGVIGFIMARILVLRLTKSIDEKQIQLKKEVYHET